MPFGRSKIGLFRWRLSARLLIASSIATVIGFTAICANVMLDMRRGEETLARQSLETLASSIDADLSRNIEVYDLSLRAVASNIVLPEIKNVSRPILQLILFDHAATAKHFGAIQVFDAEGRLTADASTLDPVRENRADEDYFKVHRDNPDVGLYISGPIMHRGAYSIVLSRRISGEDGKFLGVVVGSIRFTYFQELFARLQLSEGDTICVLRKDRTIIMRRPFDLGVIGKKISDLPRGKQPGVEPGGMFSGVGPVDDIPRLYVRVASNSPLIVVVGKPISDVFNLWRTEAIRIGALVMALIAFVLAVTLFLAREIRRRAAAEDKLEELATTDALTGLKNRRKFDEAIEIEWRRAVRYKTPLSLLMIDADHFKAYNDTYGHQAGDQVLVGIAICISDAATRAGDCAARYGGEEFAVLLPGQASAEAMMVAETIRRKVQGWSDEPTISTVSVGIASVTPTAAMDWHAFVNAADKALYAAKAAGRNCCVMAPIPVLPLAA
ncbi:MAG TPA: sensor domain-containing diguanylate cyclase [Bradyrhizobium sp.]|uniref:GGDEF domain-containing protein n=1 Tax=Bradyrhizobium sp. TaxID=376 RepID=UPI002B60C18D|nr:sensor domain-containing diguanylate cyclase [Bradyrhizobium sp.]HLZ04129.1 sensor domain-containing diguanylate cyclase [Bradyrhizobium sp.]